MQYNRWYQHNQEVHWHHIQDSMFVTLYDIMFQKVTVFTCTGVRVANLILHSQVLLTLLLTVMHMMPKIF